MANTTPTVPLTEAHLRDVVGNLTRAFAREPHLPYWTTRRDMYLRRMPGIWAALVRYSLRYGEVYTTRDFAGVVCWLVPGHPTMRVVGTVRSGMVGASLALGREGFRRLMRLGGQIEAARARDTGGRPHWYLMLLGVAPERQRRGIASALLAPVLTKADAVGLACYLETETEKNVAFYGKHGFRVFHEVTFGDVSTRLMRRDPQGRE